MLGMYENAIDVRALRCTYGAHVAVDGLDLTVAPGELVALLGTNGAGKTTTMETIEGHRAADGGQVRVLGRDPFGDRKAIRPRVGIMLQESGFAGELTVAETVLLWHRMTRRSRDPDGTIERLELAHRRDVAVEQLSGGERRRLDLALALLGRPEVLFLDEPTTGLDPQSRRHTWEVVAALVADGTAVLLTTHYLEEAEALADRVAIMHGGRIATSGTMAELVGRRRGTIAFGRPIDVSLPAFAGTAEAARGDEIVVTTDRVQEDLGTLLGWAAAHGLELERLNVRTGSLEDVFAAIQSGSGDLRPPLGVPATAPLSTTSEISR